MDVKQSCGIKRDFVIDIVELVHQRLFTDFVFFSVFDEYIPRLD